MDSSILCDSSNGVLVLAVTVFSNCPTDGGGSSIAAGQTRSVTCDGDTWGEMYRDCYLDNNVERWGDIDIQYCLPLYPASGYAYVDFYYYISNSNLQRIKADTSGIASAINSVYRVPTSEVSVHYVGTSPNTPDV